MAVLPIYRVNETVKSHRYARFPDDFRVIAESIIDAEMLEHLRVSCYRWYLNIVPHRKCVGVVSRKDTETGTRRTVYLHREIWEIANGGVPAGLTIDHKNQDTLDNRLENLRLATYSQQHANKGRFRTATSPYKGVVYFPPKHHPTLKKRWHAQVRNPGENPFSLGYYLTPEEAGLAYELASRKIFGEFVCLEPVPLDSISPDRQLEIRSIVERKLRDRGLIPSDS